MLLKSLRSALKKIYRAEILSEDNNKLIIELNNSLESEGELGKIKTNRIKQFTGQGFVRR